MNSAKKLGKYLSKLSGYEVFIGLDNNGRIGCIPLQRVHLDGKAKRVILIVPVPQPKEKPPLVQVAPAGAIPKIEIARR